VPIPTIIPSAKYTGENQREWGSAGFLGVTVADGGAFVPCGTIPQCAEDKFTFNGNLVTRVTRRASSSTHVEAWTPTDGQTCGMFAVAVNPESSTCTIDPGALGFHTALCGDLTLANSKPSAAVYNTCWTQLASTLVRTNQLSGACEGIRNYQTSAGGDTREQNVGDVNQWLNKLLSILTPPDGVTTFQQYLQASDCAAALHSELQITTTRMREDLGISSPASGIHFFLRHTTKEIPFAFWIKCYLMADSAISLSSHGIVQCTEWDDRIPYSQGIDYGGRRDVIPNLRKLDGLVRTEDVEAKKLELGASVAAMVINYATNLQSPSVEPFRHSGSNRQAGMVCQSGVELLQDPSTECKQALVRFHNINRRPGLSTEGLVSASEQYKHWDKNSLKIGDGASPGIDPLCYTYPDPLWEYPSSREVPILNSYGVRPVSGVDLSSKGNFFLIAFRCFLDCFRISSFSDRF
jgi:hypothetical protein